MTAAIAAAIGLLMIIDPVVVAAVRMAGFGPPSVGHATFASAVQSSIGNVAAGSMFSTFQSAGAGGAGLGALKTMLTAAVGLGLAAGLVGSVVMMATHGEGVKADL